MQATRERVRTFAADGRYELPKPPNTTAKSAANNTIAPSRKTTRLADHHFLSAPISNNVRCENGKYKSAAATAIANPIPICSMHKNGVNAHISSSTSKNGKSFLNFPVQSLIPERHRRKQI